MAQDTVDLLNRRDGTKPRHPTMTLPLEGSAAWPEAQVELEQRGTALCLRAETISHLANSYGSEAQKVLDLIEGDASLARPLVADLPYIYAEIIAACRYEMAMTLYDVLARRTSIMLEDRQRGLGIVEEVAACMAQEHDWSRAQQMALVEAYRADIQGQLASETVPLAT
jgi:glycerol-3-phosphate dehydrogenase